MRKSVTYVSSMDPRPTGFQPVTPAFGGQFYSRQQSVSNIRLTNQALIGFSRPFSRIYWTLRIRVSVYNQLLTLLRMPYFEPGGREFETSSAIGGDWIGQHHGS